MNENNKPQSQQTPSESALDKAPTRAPREDTTTFEERGLMESKRQRFNERLNQVMNGKPDEQSKAHERIKALEKKCHDYAIAQEGNLAKLDELNAKQAELVAENARLKAECSSHEKERYEIYSFDSSQAMEIKALQKELEQLRSERDKMSEALKVSKKALYQIVDDARLKGVKYTAKAFGLVNGAYVKVESALSGGSK